MKRGGTLLTGFIAVLMLSSFGHHQPKQQNAPAYQGGQKVDDWVYEREKKGIKVFTRKSRWGHLRDSKAMMTVSASPEQMLKVLTDFEHYQSWMPRCKKSRVLAKIGDNEFIIYQVFAAPWPVKDRDCIVRIKVDKDPHTGTILITETSEPKYLKEQSDVVRIEQLTATWKLIPSGNGTEVINEYATNPGGNIPDWMTNTQSVESPIETFEGLQLKATSLNGK